MRFPPLSFADLTPEQRAVAAEIAATPRGEVRGPYVALLHHPELARRLRALGDLLRFQGRLPGRVRELAVLITARRWSCQYEWALHAPIARQAGLEDVVIEALAAGREPALAPDDAAVYAFCQDALATGRVADAPFDAVCARFGREGALELLALCGNYSLIAMILNTAGLTPPPGAPTLPGT